MASIDSLIISKVLEERSIDELVGAGVKAHHFTGEARDAFAFILAHVAEHGAVPSKRQFTDKFDIPLAPYTDQETFSGLTAELFEAYRKRTIAEGMTDAITAIDTGSVDDAIAKLNAAITEAKAPTHRLRDFNIIQDFEERLAKYEELRKTPNALRGIPTGFYGLDKITHGLRPQQWIVIGGEQKRGKSMIMLIMADACNLSHRRPLVITQEMSNEEWVIRHDAYRAKIDYNKLLSYDLTDAEMEHLRKVLNRNKNGQDFILSEDASGLTTVSAVRAKAIEHECDALYVDGVYLMDDENGQEKGSPAALRNISQGFKRLAQDLDIPVVGTTQVLGWKLGNKKTRAVTADAFGFTTAFGQDADLLLAVERNPDIDNQSIIRVVEARSARRGEVHIQWDWQTMNFEEIDHDGEPLDPAFL